VETFGLPLLKAKAFPESDVPNCEGWANADRLNAEAMDAIEYQGLPGWSPR
jgi:hypothetical protein